MICYAIIDTNVLVSALLSSHEDAATVQVLRTMFAGDIVPVYSDEILAEYNEVLRRRKFHFSESLIINLIETITQFGICLTPTSTDEVIPDMKDLPFYEVVMEMHNQDDAYLVTGNIKHFPERPYIVTARQFLEILNKKSKNGWTLL